MKNVVKQEHYCFLWKLEKTITEWAEHYNHEQYHESLNNVTPADVYFRRSSEILDKRAITKSRTLSKRKVQNRRLAS